MQDPSDHPSDPRFTLDAAFAAAEAGDTARWVGDLLASRGSDNATLAAALARSPHAWVGPVRVPLAALVRLAGPEDDARCRVEPGEWEHDVGEMEISLDEGWEPAPLLVELRAGMLALQDGNHRYEALARAGETHAWVLVWCDDARARDEFVARHPGAPVTGHVVGAR
jgi:hypothetical protein